MENTNQTMVLYFIINGISDIPQLQAPIFFLVLLIYLTTLGGNLTILLLVYIDPQLHTPMYFFLFNLSLIDISTITVTLHKVLIGFLVGDKMISLSYCLVQNYMYSCLSVNELLLLTAMSYDRYVAICNPLHYNKVMSHRICALLVVVCLVISFSQNIPTAFIISRFTCYRSNRIDHFFCDAKPLVTLSCSDTSLLWVMAIEGALLNIVTPFLLTFISYTFIIVTILRIQSGIGRRKAFYTCSSHLTVVLLFYLTIIWQYFVPQSNNTTSLNKLFALFNTAAVPMLNPLVYSLKNKDVTSAFRRRLKW